uniref:Nucleotid_trans domain-containing protein n=1 Tax=Panagrellus redivivus TaxID=6233 RepID=A0A7E4VUX8_PANRE
MISTQNVIFRSKKLLILIFVLFGAYILYWLSPICQTNLYEEFSNDESESEWIFGSADPGIRLVTATSANHFNEAIRSCRAIAARKESKQWQRGFMIIYNLGDITAAQRRVYSHNCPFVEWRSFDFDRYPSYVRSLKEYRWKPLLVNEVLREASKVFYFDSSVLISPNTSYGFEKTFNEMESNYSTCGFRQYERTHHTMFSATHPAMFRYFDFDIEEAKATEMYGATLFTILRNQASIKIIQKWVDCALAQGCMAPTGHNVHCDSKALGTGAYANCHRYDQAALAILLAQCSHDQSAYAGTSDMYSVNRG